MGRRLSIVARTAGKLMTKEWRSGVWRSGVCRIRLARQDAGFNCGGIQDPLNQTSVPRSPLRNLVREKRDVPGLVQPVNARMIQRPRFDIELRDVPAQRCPQRLTTLSQNNLRSLKSLPQTKACGEAASGLGGWASE